MARVAAPLAALLLVAPALSGCLVLRIPGLFEDPPKSPVSAPPSGNGTAQQDFRIDGIVWKRNDTWVWLGSNGVRVTDRVTDVRQVQKEVRGQILTVTRYEVQTKEEHGGGLLVLWSNHTYEPELGVVNSSAPGESVQYLRGDSEFRNNPLTYVGNVVFNVSFNLTRWGRSEVIDRSTNFTRLGPKIAQVPAGDFQAIHTRLNITTDQGFNTPRGSEVIERWFNVSVKNDVKIVRRGVTWNLYAFRVDGDARALVLPPLAAAASGWRTGWGWHYSGPGGVSVTRDVVPCTTYFAQCRDLSERFVHERNKDYFAYRTQVHYGRAAGFLTTTEIALVSTAALAPVAVDFLYSARPEVWSPDLNYTPQGLSILPPGTSAQQEFDVRGRAVDSFPMDHRGVAKVAVGESLRVRTPYGWVDGREVETNVTYYPREVGYRILYEETARVWAPAVRNDVQFKLLLGGTAQTFTLDGVSFLEARKAERDI